MCRRKTTTLLPSLMEFPSCTKSPLALVTTSERRIFPDPFVLVRSTDSTSVGMSHGSVFMLLAKSFVLFDCISVGLREKADVPDSTVETTAAVINTVVRWLNLIALIVRTTIWRENDVNEMNDVVILLVWNAMPFVCIYD